MKLPPLLLFISGYRSQFFLVSLPLALFRKRIISHCYVIPPVSPSSHSGKELLPPALSSPVSCTSPALYPLLLIASRPLTLHYTPLFEHLESKSEGPFEAAKSFWQTAPVLCSICVPLPLIVCRIIFYLGTKTPGEGGGDGRNLS